MQAQNLVLRIQETCDAISAQLDDPLAELEFALRRRPTRRRAPTVDDSQASSNEFRTVKLCFPGQTAEDAWRFSKSSVVFQLPLMLSSCGITPPTHRSPRSKEWHRSYQKVRLPIVGHHTCSHADRDIYYQDPGLFGSQAVVDRYVEDLAFTFSVPRAQLNVAAAAKGIIHGSLKLQYKDGTLLDLSQSPRGVLVPNAQDILSSDLTRTSWILVVEKEATFQLLLTSTHPALRRGLIVTAKGYPDVATRSFLQTICRMSPQNSSSTPKLYGLVDYDPDGFAIYSHYKYGANQQLGVEQSSLPEMQLLGLLSKQLDFSQHTAKSMLVLTDRDRKRARNMLKDDPAAHEDDVRLDLQRMLMLNVKVELQHLEGFIVDLCASVLDVT
ncbi:hypothetical protein AMS68_007192 [Peltaster fructicola]|uniref:DNA topoisomerase (ATP-hydrolyzing) n=1 Tax=Peltaster fructicola TaxID=286661 RepID=A0A6H0Y423_9PEZI|nr:hypothetical protein AMS68_007192 [Peltaster fructicola]